MRSMFENSRDAPFRDLFAEIARIEMELRLRQLPDEETQTVTQLNDALESHQRSLVALEEQLKQKLQAAEVMAGSSP